VLGHPVPSPHRLADARGPNASWICAVCRRSWPAHISCPARDAVLRDRGLQVLERTLRGLVRLLETTPSSHRGEQRLIAACEEAAPVRFEGSQGLVVYAYRDGVRRFRCRDRLGADQFAQGDGA